MHVCVCVCMYVCMCVYMYIYIDICMSAFCVCVCTYVHPCASVVGMEGSKLTFAGFLAVSTGVQLGDVELRVLD